MTPKELFAAAIRKTDRSLSHCDSCRGPHVTVDMHRFYMAMAMARLKVNTKTGGLGLKMTSAVFRGYPNFEP